MPIKTRDVGGKTLYVYDGTAAIIQKRPGFGRVQVERGLHAVTSEILNGLASDGQDLTYLDTGVLEDWRIVGGKYNETYTSEGNLVYFMQRERTLFHGSVDMSIDFRRHMEHLPWIGDSNYEEQLPTVPDSPGHVTGLRGKGTPWRSILALGRRRYPCVPLLGVKSN